MQKCSQIEDHVAASLLENYSITDDNYNLNIRWGFVIGDWG